MSIGKNYIRISPDGIETHIQITNQRFLEYYRDLKENHGYKFKPVAVIHTSEATCVSCEG